MINCNQATRLMSEARDRPLTFKERWALKFHKSMCSGCRQFDRQMDFIQKATKGYTFRPKDPDDKGP